MSRNEKLILVLGQAIPALLFVAFLIYWFKLRDTWELDNRPRIIDLCNKAQDAILRSSDEDATSACDELTSFVGERQIRDIELASKIQSVRTAYDPVRSRLEAMRRQQEARELAELQEREARAMAARREIANADHDSFYNPDRDPPYLANLKSGHETQSAAIAALASQFNESTGWVEANMGTTNSIVAIHLNLARAKLRAAGVKE